MPDNKVIAAELNTKAELKKYMKRVMPFVQATREKMDTLGVAALNLTLDFDEVEVLKINQDYLRSTLDVSVLNFFQGCFCFYYSVINVVFSLKILKSNIPTKRPRKQRKNVVPAHRT